MEYFSIGNTIGLQWSVEYYGGAAFPLSKCDVRLFSVTSRGVSEITDFAILGNGASWQFNTTDQYAGSYSFVMDIREADRLNCRLVWDHALRLSSYSGANSTGMVITHTSVLDTMSSAVALFGQVTPESINKVIEDLDDLTDRVETLEATNFEGNPTSDDNDYPDIEQS